MKSTLGILSILVMTAMVGASAFATDLTQDFNFDGYLLDASSNPLVGTYAVKFQVYNPGATCLLFEETHAAVNTASDGSFSVKVGNGARASPGVDGGLAYKAIYQNDSTIRAAATTNCTPGYTPASGDGRKLRVTVGATVLTPDYSISAVPMATVAETLQGKNASDFMPSTAYTLPAADGTNTQVLQTNGAGTVNWATVSAGGITSINGLATSSQSFSNSTSGVGPNWSAAGSIHTLNIPMASSAGVTGGLLSKADYDSFSAKMDPITGTTTNNIIRWTGAAWTETNGLQVSGAGEVSVLNSPTASSHAATKAYVDAATTGFNDADITDVGVDKITSGGGKYFSYMPNNTSCGNGEFLEWNTAFTRWECGSTASFLMTTGGTLSGVLNSTQRFSSTNGGSATTPTYAISGGNGIFSAAANTIGVATNGLERIRVVASGNVGVGTTTPSEMLDVMGKVKAESIIFAGAGGSPGTGCAIMGEIAYNTGAERFVFCDGSIWHFVGGAKSPDSGTGSSASFNLTNNVTVSTPSSPITLNGMQNGGEYKVILQSAPSSTYSFIASGGACGTWKYKTPNAATTASTDTIYRIQIINGTCYVDWATGYAP